MADNFLTRKIGPVPGYVWVLGGAAALLLYRSYAQSKQQQAGTTTTGATSAAAQAQALQAAQQQQLLASEMASAYYPTYEQGQTPLYVLNTSGTSTPAGNSTSTASGTPAATTPSQSPAPAQRVSGLGYVSTTPVNVGNVTYFPTQSGAQDAALLASNQTLYWEPAPGQFLPWTAAVASTKGVTTPTGLYFRGS